MIVVVLAGCGNHASPPAPKGMCSSMERLCGMTAEGSADCPTLERTIQMATPPDVYAKIEQCTRDATTCEALFTCMADTVRKAPDDDDRPSVTAPECAHLPAICSARDAERTGDACQRMVDNVREDPTHRAQLGRCIEAANNCFAAEHCIDQLWFDLH